MKNSLIFSIIYLFIFFLPQINLYANYKDVFPVNKTFIYKHIQKETQKITGKSIFSFTIQTKQGTSYFVEISENINSKGETFTQKKTWLKQDTGEFFFYEEEDLRIPFKVKNKYTKSKIHTTVTQKKEKTEFSILQKSKRIPLEALTYFIKSRIPEILDREKIKFELYFPAVAFELKKKSLPVSWSIFGVVATLEKEILQTSIYGNIRALKINIVPTSWWLKKLLPEDQQKIIFFVQKSYPHTILEFHQGKTKYLLKEEVKEQKNTFLQQKK